MYKQLLERADKGSVVQFPGFEKRFLVIYMQIRDGNAQHLGPSDKQRRHPWESLG